jgi:hypothetical protein
MKHIVKTIAIAFMAGTILMAGTATAGNSKPLPFSTYRINSAAEASFNLKVNKLMNTESVQVTIEKIGGKRLVVSLIGPDGSTLGQFTTQKKPGVIEVSYNFYGAEEGTYTLQASDGKEKKSKKIVLSRSKAQVVTDMVIE